VRARSIVAWQITCVLIGLAASLIPVFPRTHTFWGCNYSWISLAPNQVSIHDVLPDSPASAARLRDGDQVLYVGSQRVNDVSTWKTLERIAPGQVVGLRVKRGQEDVTLTASGFEPQQEAVLYYHWQLAYAGGCVALVVLLVATGPLRPLPSLWRPILLVLTGLATTAALLLTDWQSPWAAMLWRRRWPVDNFPYPWVQVAVCVGVALTTVALGTWEIRGIIATCQKAAAHAGPNGYPSGRPEALPDR
jgi:hypothetical protein